MNIEEGRLYTNIKTGRVYEVIYVAIAAWDGNPGLVVCQDVRKKQSSAISSRFDIIWVYTLDEFDNSFKREGGMTTPADGVSP